MKMINREVYEILLTNSARVMVEYESSLNGYHASSVSSVSSAGQLITTYTCIQQNGKNKVTVVFVFDTAQNVLQTVWGTTTTSIKALEPIVLSSPEAILPASFATTLKPFVKSLFSRK